MNNKILIKIFAIIFVTLVSGCSGGNFAEEKYTLRGVVVEVGDCGDQSGNYQCVVKARFRNGIQQTYVYGSIMTGAVIYKHCWKEEDGNHCFKMAEDRIRKSFK